jgi:hypothetical protein
MKEEGIGGFYRGLTASYWGCTEGAVQFVLYERIKSRLLNSLNEQRLKDGLPPTEDLPKATYFFSAAFAKGVASILTYPHEVARTRLREQARSGVFKYNGMWNTIGIIAREEGRSGESNIYLIVSLSNDEVPHDFVLFSFDNRSVRWNGSSFNKSCTKLSHYVSCIRSSQFMVKYIYSNV